MADKAHAEIDLKPVIQNIVKALCKAEASGENFVTERKNFKLLVQKVAADIAKQQTFTRVILDKLVLVLDDYGVEQEQTTASLKQAAIFDEWDAFSTKQRANASVMMVSAPGSEPYAGAPSWGQNGECRPRVARVALSDSVCAGCQCQLLAAIDVCIYCFPNNVPEGALVCEKCFITSNKEKRRDQGARTYPCRNLPYTDCGGVMVPLTAEVAEKHRAEFDARFERMRQHVEKHGGL